MNAKDPQSIIPRAYSRSRDRLLDEFIGIHELSAQMQSGWQEAAAQLVKSTHAPFLFVVVGEGKSGKSSLINALLGVKVCEVAPDPCTDRIQKIVYSEKEYQRRISDEVVERGMSHEALKKIAIVDSPGTNSILENHQALTERFIPQSDLALFVFQALNPYSKTAWDFFGFVSQKWRKKIVFILQQADRATPEELAVNIRRVGELARERGMEEPRIFAVSAKKSLDGGRDEGLEALKSFIEETVTGGRHYRLKLESLLGTAREILAGLDRELASEAGLLEEDRKEGRAIEEALVRGREAARSEMELLKARLLEAYDRLSGHTVESFEEGLSVLGMLKNTFRNLIGRKNPLKRWVEDLHRDFEESFTKEVERLAGETAGRVTQHLSRLMESLMDQLRRSRPGKIGLASLARERLDVLDEVTRQVLSLLSGRTLSERMRPEGLHRLGDRALVGGFLTAVGALIAASAHAVAFDVTGGVFATLGALLAIHTVVFRRGAVVRGFRQGYAQGREQLDRDLDSRLDSQVELIFDDLRRAFDPFFKNLEERGASLEGLRSRHGDFVVRLEGEGRLLEAAEADGTGE